MNPHDILNFWFDDENKEFLFQKSEAFDEKLKQRFTEVQEQAVVGNLDGWLNNGADATLALILLLDQLPRNFYRDQARAFATDGKAVQMTYAALQRGYDLVFKYEKAIEKMAFLYMPLMHSELLDNQRRCVDLMLTHVEDAIFHSFARAHHDIIVRFGRFPHRNKALGRVSTPEEQVFLTQPGSGF
ncbi:MAG: DUF924 family protein [Pseudomonadota bacterium]